jgi:hypothetical protein
MHAMIVGKKERKATHERTPISLSEYVEVLVDQRPHF